MIKLSIPFTKDNRILSLVKGEHLSYISEIFMPVPHSIIESARPYMAATQKEYETLIEENVKRAKEMGLKVSFVANKQFIPHEKLRSTSLKLCKFLKRMKEEYDIDKVVLSNLYIIQQYGELIQSMGIEVELSILAGIDSYSALKEYLTIAPHITSVCLSDKLVHNLDEIAAIKQDFAGVSLKIIPNHGCLIGCPFEKQHHHYSACTFAEETDDMIQNSINIELNIANDTCAGCRRYLSNAERHIKEMSFIRPEDIHLYVGAIDMLKISGREHSAENVIEMIEAYGAQNYDGDLEEILDMNRAENTLPNKGFPQGFGQKRSGCKNQCYKCNYCNIIQQFVKSHLNEENIEV